MNAAFAKLKRRDLLRLACVTGLGLAIPLSRLSEIGSSDVRQSVTRKSIKALGTTVTITVEEDTSPVRAEAGTDDAFRTIKNLEMELTRFYPSSPVYRLNKEGRLEKPTSELLDALVKARYFSDKTDGAFDITVKPALDLLERYLEGAPLPTDADVERAKRPIDFESFITSKADLHSGKPGMSITLDCIGKGYALDMAAARLRAHGISSALGQGGGTLVAVGRKLDGSPWRIGVRDPRNPNEYIAMIGLADGAVATSGDYEDFVSPDGTSYHVVDPASARSPLFSHSATVTAPTAQEADPLGVALMVKDPQEGLKFLEGFGGFEYLIAARDGRLLRSSHFGVIS